MLLQNTRLQLLPLFTDFLGLFNDLILSSDVRVSLFQFDNGLVAAPLEVLVEEHSVRQHFLDVTYLDGQVRRQVAAVDLDIARVVINVAPDLDLVDQEAELTAGLKVQRKVLLDMDERHGQQVRAARDEALELDKHGPISLEVPSDLVAGDGDLLAVVPEDERADAAVVRPRDRERHAPGKDDVEVLELVSLLYDGGHRLLLVHLLEAVLRLAITQRVEVDLARRDVRFALVHLPHLLGVELGGARQLRVDHVSVCAVWLLRARWRSEQEVLLPDLVDELLHCRLLDRRRHVWRSSWATASALRRLGAEHADVHPPQRSHWFHGY